MQTLPALLHSYSAEMKGELLFALLQTCSSLQVSKNSAVSSTAAATLQQLVISVFDKLAIEDKTALEIPVTAEVSIGEESVALRPMAHDAYRIFHDVSALTVRGKAQYVRLSLVSENSSLELVEAVLVNYSDLIRSHEELAYILQRRLLPFMVKTFSEKESFPITVRVARLIFLTLRNYLDIFPAESEAMLNLLNQLLEPEVAPLWKRVLCMEIFRGIFSDYQLVLQIQARFNTQNGSKAILRGSLGSFVRMASEKPALIGLGQQSTVPVGNYFQRETVDNAASTDTVQLPNSTAGVATSAVPGISQQFSSVKNGCIEQLDKAEPPSLPETYVYSLVLTCLNSLAEGLAKFILPLTVHSVARGKKKSKTSHVHEEPVPDSPSAENAAETVRPGSLKRSQSYRRKAVPENPLLKEHHPAFDEIQAAANLVQDCWPAILACSSTFLYSALDTENYRALVRSFQKFTQVVGLFRLSTPRDAFLTTLGKAAVPSHVLTSAFSTGQQSTQSPSSKNLVVENIVTQAANLLPERSRRASIDSGEPTLNTRNLLCLRALINLAIALGPTLDSAWTIVFEIIQQADNILATSNLRSRDRERPVVQTQNQASGEGSYAQLIGSEVAAVQSAVSRLFESTVDFPNDAFKAVLEALCGRLHSKRREDATSREVRPKAPKHQRRVPSFSGISVNTDAHEHDAVFILAKVRELASLNLDRFIEFGDDESGWTYLTTEMTFVVTDKSYAAAARMLATELVSRLAQDTVASAPKNDSELQDQVQYRALLALNTICTEIGRLETKTRTSSMEETVFGAHGVVLEALRAILERAGEMIQSGWETVFEMIQSSFVPANNSTPRKPIQENNSVALRAVGLGRLAFSCLQLICSDFHSSISGDVLVLLTDTLFWFGSQRDDLNIALTVRTTFCVRWHVTDL